MGGRTPWETAEPPVVAARRGDAFALDDLLSLITPYVTRLCEPLAPHDTADAVQEALTVVFRGLGGVRDPRGFYARVRTVTVREAVRVAGRTRHERPVDPADLVALGPSDDASGTDGLSPEVRDVLARLPVRDRTVLVLHTLEGPDERAVADILQVAPDREIPTAQGPLILPEGMDTMTAINIDTVARLRVIAAGLRGAMYAEEHVAVPYDQVWAVVEDLEGELPHLIPGLREFRVPPGLSDRKRAVAVGVLGAHDAFDVRLAPGWCLMQSGLILGAMALVPEGDGTRFAVLGAVRPPALGQAQSLYRRILGDRRGHAFVRAVTRRAVLRAPARGR